MTMDRMLRCKECDGEMTLAPLPLIEGEEHGLHLKIDGLPALRCANGHTRFVAATFPANFLDRLLSAPDLVPLDAANEKGFLRKRYCCPACGQVLDTQHASRVEAEHSMAFDGLRPVAVHLDLPSYRCGSCGHECVEPRDAMVSDLMRASTHAFRSAHIAPV
jgi:ribosomal protein S27AE